MKFRIQQLYRGNIHYVWCSPIFEAAAMPRYAIGSGQPASSDPASIYRQLHEAVRTRDKGDAKILEQKKVLKSLAVKWLKDGSISKDQRDEIVAMVSYSEVADWRPLIYVIPCGPIAPRVQVVPVRRRASLEPEYIVEDLQFSEFDIIEPMPCR